MASPSPASTRPQRSPDEVEDIILRKILLVSLTPPANPSPAVAYLELTAAELLSESRPLLALRDAAERLLIDRLSLPDPPAGSPTPFAFLVSAFRRAADEARKISTIRDAALRARLAASIAHLRGGHRLEGGAAVDRSHTRGSRSWKGELQPAKPHKKISLRCRWHLCSRVD